LSEVRNSQEDVGFALSRTLLVATYGRCYFRAQGGGQGLCHPTVEAGDEVWVIDGSKVPFILRRAHLIIDEGEELRPQNAYGVDEDGHFGLESDFQSEYGPYVHYYLVCDCSKFRRISWTARQSVTTSSRLCWYRYRETSGHILTLKAF
jgi:hypothetical protein